MSLESKINGDGEVEETKNDNNESLKRYFEAYYGYRSQPTRQKEKKNNCGAHKDAHVDMFRREQKMIYYNID